MKEKNIAAEIANLTFRLLSNCQLKEKRLSDQLNLTVSEFRVLRNFGSALHLNIKKLTERMQLTASRLTRILDGLEKKHIIVRSVDSRDRRSIVITLTEIGKSITNTLQNKYIEIHEEILKDIPSKDQESVQKGLQQLLQSLETWLETS
ncbi:MAG: MarR family transcriptional regulator [Bacteroidota bacterium]